LSDEDADRGEWFRQRHRHQHHRRPPRCRTAVTLPALSLTLGLEVVGVRCVDSRAEGSRGGGWQVERCDGTAWCSWRRQQNCSRRDGMRVRADPCLTTRPFGTFPRCGLAVSVLVVLAHQRLGRRPWPHLPSPACALTSVELAAIFEGGCVWPHACVKRTARHCRGTAVFCVAPQMDAWGWHRDRQ